MEGIASILIVDDNPKLLSEALPMYGYNVTVANNGIDALKMLNQQSYDLILLDIMMPVMNGLDTLRVIRQNKATSSTPIIMVSAISEDQKIISGLKMGADDYIIKPFVLPNLLARIEALLRRSNWQNQKNSKTSETDKNSDLELLTPKEKEVLSLVAKGNSNQEIANTLCVQDVTVKTHLNSIFKKLKVNNRTQAVLLAMQMGMVK